MGYAGVCPSCGVVTEHTSHVSALGSFFDPVANASRDELIIGNSREPQEFSSFYWALGRFNAEKRSHFSWSPAISANAMSRSTTAWCRLRFRIWS